MIASHPELVLIELVAQAYAAARLDATRGGESWVHVDEFAHAATALRVEPGDVRQLRELYATMLEDLLHVSVRAKRRAPLATTTPPVARKKLVTRTAKARSRKEETVRSSRTSMVTFGANLRAARLYAGLTQPGLAALIKSQQGSVSRWELGKSAPLPYMVTRLCTALNRTSDELTHGDLALEYMNEMGLKTLDASSGASDGGK
jgi:ribosome-binding protein aMBF1 (putative translation factor)